MLKLNYNENYAAAAILSCSSTTTGKSHIISNNQWIKTQEWRLLSFPTVRLWETLLFWRWGSDSELWYTLVGDIKGTNILASKLHNPACIGTAVTMSEHKDTCKMKNPICGSNYCYSHDCCNLLILVDSSEFDVCQGGKGYAYDTHGHEVLP